MVGVEELKNVLRGQVGEVVHGFPTVKHNVPVHGTDKQLGKVVQVVVVHRTCSYPLRRERRFMVFFLSKMVPNYVSRLVMGWEFVRLAG